MIATELSLNCNCNLVGIQKSIHLVNLKAIQKATFSKEYVTKHLSDFHL